MLVLGVVGLAGNVAATWVLAAGEREDINLEGVLRHSAGDALSSLGVVVAGALVLVAGWDAADPIAGLLIAVLIAASSWRLLKEPVDVLLESAPAGTDVRAVGEAMAAEPQVVEVHDLHVWTVTSGFPALSAHVVVDRGAGRDEVLARMERMLAERFDIHHTTLQVVECADPEELIQLQRADSAWRGRVIVAVVDSVPGAAEERLERGVAPGGGSVAGDRADHSGLGVRDDVGVDACSRTPPRGIRDVGVVGERMRALRAAAEHGHVAPLQVALAFRGAQGEGSSRTSAHSSFPKWKWYRPGIARLDLEHGRAQQLGAEPAATVHHAHGGVGPGNVQRPSRCRKVPASSCGARLMNIGAASS